MLTTGSGPALVVFSLGDCQSASVVSCRPAIRQVRDRRCVSPSRVTMAEGSKPPSVRSGIQLSVRTSVRATRWFGLAPVRIRRSIRSPRFAPRSVPRRVETVEPSRSPWWVNSPSLPVWSLGVRAPHRSRGGVSFLFQRRRSPAPGLRPVTCPDGGGTFLVRVTVAVTTATGAGLPLPPKSTRPTILNVRSRHRHTHPSHPGLPPWWIGAHSSGTTVGSPQCGQCS